MTNDYIDPDFTLEDADNEKRDFLSDDARWIKKPIVKAPYVAPTKRTVTIETDENGRTYTKVFFS